MEEVDIEVKTKKPGVQKQMPATMHAGGIGPRWMENDEGDRCSAVDTRRFRDDDDALSCCYLFSHASTGLFKQYCKYYSIYSLSFIVVDLFLSSSEFICWPKMTVYSGKT